MPSRCLIIQSDGVHRGQDGLTPNWYTRECYALQHAFRENDVEADIWGLRHENFANPPDFESYDMVLCLENYEFDWLPDFRRMRRPLTIQWIVDLHFQGPRRYQRLSRGFDVILHSTRSLIFRYRLRVPFSRHLWFPNGFDERYYDAAKSSRPKTKAVIFVGSPLPGREAFIDELRERVGLEIFFALGQDMVDLVASTRIHFNKHIGCDVNYRTFETIGLGTCLVTDRSAELTDLGFVDGENCLTYASVEEAAEKIQAALADGSWQSIGKAGYQLSKRHTYVERVRALLQELAER